MIVIILCGGIGSRMEDYSYPKPLNMIYGKPSISYCLQNLPKSIQTIHFIVAPHLVKYNFAQTVTNEFKSRTCIFHYLPYFTRGSIESAFLGCADIESADENIVFLDNDVLYNFPETMFEEKQNPFIGYALDKTNNTKYSYIKINEENYLTEFKEKIRISDLFCCGVYGFQSISQFREYATARLTSNTSSELYMSLLFQDMIKKDVKIQGIHFKGSIYHIGSLKELKNTIDDIPKHYMRVCFDLDNTLVTYPEVPNDYSTVKPIEPMIKLLRKMHEEGHTIIIHTARRMKTHNNNLGAVIKDIGKVTFDTLEKFNIPYDELLFGKPIADMYIDDRAINPYRNDLFSLGYIYGEEKVSPLNSLSPNKYNTLEVVENKVIKRGPAKFIQGEIYYYKNLPQSSILLDYFPKYFGSFLEEDAGVLEIEHIQGIPMFTLYKSNFVTIEYIDMCLEFLNILHSFHTEDTKVSNDLVKANYIEKLRERFAVVEDYPFEDARSVQEDCLVGLEEYLNQTTLELVNYIHGDFWFSNMSIDFKGKLKVFDMKGKVHTMYTTSGDKLYDYGKLYQSILGYDCVLNRVAVPQNASILRMHFENQLAKNNIVLKDLRAVTFSLVIGTLPFIESCEAKQRVWEWIKKMFVETPPS